MRRHSRLPSRPIARGRSSPGRARNRRWRTCSSISWVAPRTVCNDDVVCNARAARIRRVLASDVGDADQGVHSAQARPRLVRHDHHDSARSAPAVRLRHQHQSPAPADRGAAAGAERSRPFHPQGDSEHRIFRRHPHCRRRNRVRSSTRLRRGAVRDRDSCQLRARGAPRRPSGAAGRRPRDRPGARGLGLIGVPLLGSLVLLALLSTLFITTNLSVGYTFSTIAQNQLQAMQMSMMFFLPNILLSGFMFPFAGMPAWAQWIGEVLPLTHYLRIVRGIMLKGAALADLRYDALALAGLMLVAMLIAISRF